MNSRLLKIMRRPPGTPHRRAQSGVALILVISFIAAMVASGILVNRQVRGMIGAVATLSDDFRVREKCRSGVQALVLLIENGAPEEVLAWLTDEEAASELVLGINQVLGYADAPLALALEDDRARIQVNALIDFAKGGQFVPEQQQLWERFLYYLKSSHPDDLDFSEVEIINSLKDWLDSGDDDAVTGLSGAESDYYETLPSPYHAANAPMQDIGELRRVKGVPPELFDGGALPGLPQFLTTGGAAGTTPGALKFDGSINLNTASTPVIAAILPLAYQSLAESIVAYRNERLLEKDYITLLQPEWYRNAPGCSDVDLPANLTTVVTERFRITAETPHGEGRYRLTADILCQRSNTAAAAACTVSRYR